MSWYNSYAHRTNYLLSQLVVYDRWSHHYVGTAAKSSRFHYYSCQTYLQKGKSACDAPLLNKNKLENAVLDRIHKRILSTDNVRRFIALATAAMAQKQKPTAEGKTIAAAITDADAKLRRWAEALERGLLWLEDAAQHIRDYARKKPLC